MKQQCRNKRNNEINGGGQIFSANSKNTRKSLTHFVVRHLLIDIVKFVWSYVRPRRQVIHKLVKQTLSGLRLKA